MNAIIPPRTLALFMEVRQLGDFVNKNPKVYGKIKYGYWKMAHRAELSHYMPISYFNLGCSEVLILLWKEVHAAYALTVLSCQ
jgi:hypothetical protein